MSINTLPNASQQQVRQMQKDAEERMKRDGVETEEVESQPLENKHPMLAHHEEPSMNFQDDTPELQEEDETEVDEESGEEDYVAPVENAKEMNYRAMRESKEKAERERDEAMKYAMSFHSQNRKQEPEAQPEQEEDYLQGLGIDNDGLAEGKHLRQVLKEIRQLKKELNSYKSQSALDTVEVRLKSQYADFDNVLTKENIDSLTAMNPDLAEMINNTPDIYKRGKLAYDMVKQLGIYKDKSFDKDKVIARKNSSKPRPLASVSPQQGDTPLSKANAFASGALSKEVKNQHYKEMLEAMKGR